MAPKRSLFLHLSALSDAEYAVYLEALRDILDDGDKPGVSEEELENKKVSLPVVRAWMKGRFRDVGSGEIDKLLHFFAPQTPQKEMSGGQFLAALRLLMHVRQGGDVNEGSVFIQAEPSSPTLSRHPTFLKSPDSISELKTTTTDAPSSPSKRGSMQTNPFYNDSFVHGPNITGLAPPGHANIDSFRRASLPSAPVIPPASSKPRVDGAGVPPGSTNPFLQRAKTHSGTYEPNLILGRTPPLPPRKPTHMSSASAPSKPPQKPPPVPAKPFHPIVLRPIASSNSASSASSSGKGPSPKPVPPHSVTPLMQQSLLASRVGASLKRAQEEAGRTRVLEVIRSSSDTSGPRTISKERGRVQSSSRSPEKGARRPVPQPPRTAHAPAAKSDSGAPSVASLAEVASAQLSHPCVQTRPDSPDRHSSSSGQGDRTPARSRQLASDQFSPPPTHPARRPSAHSSGRSRHLRSPSFQTYNSQRSPVASVSSINKSMSTPGVFNENRSSSPSPSLPPVSLTHVRPTRSQSLRQPPSPSLDETAVSGALVPSQQKRPESAQFSSRPRLLDLDQTSSDTHADPMSPFENSFGVRRQGEEGSGDGVVSSVGARFNKPAQRNAAQERDRDKDVDREIGPFSSLQRTFSALQQRAQPAITRARFKAEAGLLAPRRGFVPNGRDYHLAGEGGDRLVSQNNTGDEAGMDSTSVTDLDNDEGGGGDDAIRSRGRTRSEYRLSERDNLKLPEGEGWTRL